MRTPFSPLFLAAVGLVMVPWMAPAQEAPADAGLQRESIEWCDIWFTHADKTDKPRVLLIGDSITRGYYDGVASELGDGVYTGRYTSSRSICDPVYFQELELVLKQYKYAVIHFNHGLHGWGYTAAQYAEAFDKLLRVLREEGQGAKLVWASTTPVQSGSAMAKDQARVAERNRIAAEKSGKAGIPTDDLYAIAIDKPELYSKDGVHFAEKGKELQAKSVAGAIKQELAGLGK